jgi:AcrR family transcriptional regulator
LQGNIVTDIEFAALLHERRPQRADARRNFDALVEAGREVFGEAGVTASLEEIARRAGVGIGTLYRNFASRDALVEAVYLEEVASVVTYAEGLGDAAPFDSLTAWLRRFADYASTKKVLLEGLNRESPLLQSCRGVMYQAGEPLLARAQNSGDLRKDVAIDDVVRLVSGVSGVAFPDTAQRDRVLSIAIDGLRARPKP